MQEQKLDTQAQRTKERNRVYAARTRQRKVQQLQQLRQRCAHLEGENAQLRRELHLVQEENAKLRATSHLGGGAQPRSSASAASDGSAFMPSHGGVTAHATVPGAMADVPPADNPCARAAANTARFTAAAVGAQKLPPPVSGAAAFKAAQQRVQATPSVPLAAQHPAQLRPAAAVAESTGAGSSAPLAVSRSRRVKRGRGESLAVTLGDVGTKRSRGVPSPCYRS